MRLLVGTLAFLWFLANDPQLSPLAKSFQEEPTNELVPSLASLPRRPAAPSWQRDSGGPLT
ncbi:hypothetical protein BE17_49745 [Sorangium cellulosum]|uniref:Uncharacterized protein n=1 Tax=Sorangium cellulosum TaxID=56 RepID=A0A150RSS2_SORCE|nr:hypothetical protein BE17_49745 [Sorangium cellulosum]